MTHRHTRQERCCAGPEVALPLLRQGAAPHDRYGFRPPSAARTGFRSCGQPGPNTVMRGSLLCKQWQSQGLQASWLLCSA